MFFYRQNIGIAEKMTFLSNSSNVSLGRTGDPAEPQYSQDSSHRSQQLISIFLDSLLGNSRPSNHFQVSLRDGFNLREALRSLPSQQSRVLRDALGPGGLTSLVSLSQESDSSLFFRDAITLATGGGHGGRMDLGTGLLGNFLRAMDELPHLANACPARYRNHMRQELNAMEARGPFVNRLEYQFEQFIDQTPVNLVGFGVAAGTFQLTHCTLLSMMLRSPTGNTLGRVLGARLLAALGGVTAESVALSMTVRGLNHLSGRSVDWSGASLGRDILATGITLGFLRTGGFLARGAFNRFHGITPFRPFEQSMRFSGFTRVSRVLFPQMAMFGAIVLADKTENALGLRPGNHGGDLLSRSIETWLHFNLAGRIFERVRPASFARWTQSIEVRSRQIFHEALNRSTRNLNHSFPRTSDTRNLAMAGAEGINFPGFNLPRGRRRSILQITARDLITLMSSKDSDGSSPPPSSRKSSPSGGRVETPALTGDAALLLKDHPLPAVVTNEIGKIIYLNEAASRLLVRGSQELIGTWFHEIFVGEESRPDSTCTVREVGSRFLLEKTTRPYPGEGGKTIIHLTDITELTQLRDHARRCVTCPNRAKAGVTDILRMVLHDINNQLIAITGFDELTLPRLLEIYERYGRAIENPREFNSNIENSAFLNGAIEEVMHLIETSRTLIRGEGIPRRPFDLSDSVLGVASQSIRAREGRVVVVSNIEPGIVYNGNRVLIQSAILNLVKNSIEAIPGAGTVEISTRRVGAEVLISISDTGPGIAPQNLGRIFELDYTTKSHGQGLGLPMVRKTIEDFHGGRIQIRSVLGSGTTFKILLPDEPQLP